jgi:PadR family transcriptional regulator PadR
MFDRDLVRSIASPVILKLLQERTMYGYEIIKTVNERTEGRFQWKEGTLYPCLHRLESDGLIESEWQVSESNRKRKYYHITPKGEILLADKVSEWGQFTDTVNQVLFHKPQEA